MTEAPTDAVTASFIRSLVTKPVFIIFLIGMVIRLLFIPVFANNYDTYYWATTIQHVQSGNGLYDLTGYYYTPVWGYFLAVLGLIGTSLGIGDFGMQFDELVPICNLWWSYNSPVVTSIEFNVLVKTLLTAFDIATGILVYKIVMHISSNEKAATVGFALWFICPLVIQMSAVQCMFDCISAFFILLSIYCLLKDRYLFAGAMFSVAVMTKYFPAYMIFALVAYVLAKNKTNRNDALKKLSICIAGAAVACLLIYLPQIIEGSFMDSLSFLTNRIDTASQIGSENVITISSLIESVGFSLIIILQPIIIGICCFLAYRLYSSDDLDRSFLSLLMITSMTMFLWPPTPQYLVVSIPFLACYIAVEDRRFIVPYVLIGFGAALFAIIMPNFTLSTPFAGYTQFLDMSEIVALNTWMQTITSIGVSRQILFMIPAAVLEIAGTWYAVVLWLKDYKHDRRFVRSPRTYQRCTDEV